jgi:hypothetical protein
MILTSPPYVGAQKYIRASSLSLGWLGLLEGKSLRQLEDANIGREHFPMKGRCDHVQTGLPEADEQIGRIARRNPLRARITATYLVEMQASLRESARVLKAGGHLVLVAGNNHVCGQEFHTQSHLSEIIENLGLRPRLKLVDAIRSRGLMTRRNATASVITREWVLLFQKPGGKNAQP